MIRQVRSTRAVFCGVFVLALLASGIPLAADDGKDEILRFLDDTMPGHLTEYHVPGAAVAVVKDGAVAASRGYGTADLDLGSPVDPGRTLFRIASVTKLLTWTAVMQLVERGLVDLDEDVNSYLKSVRVPAAFGAPVTMRQLMTHTAGFEDVGIGTLRYTPQAPGSLASYLSAHLPSRVKPPGTSIMYSNHGAALAGLVVEEVAGMPYEQYVEREILAPLRMEHTSVLQPLPEALRSNLSKSYVRAGGSFRPTTYAVDLLGPRSSGMGPRLPGAAARRPYTTIEKLNRAVPVERISAVDLGSFMFLGRRWTPVRPGLFSDTTSDDLLRVLTDVRGRVTGVAVGGFAFDRLTFFQHPSLHIILTLLCGAILLSAIAVWPIRAVLRRRKAQPGARVPGSVPRWLAGIGAALALASSAAIVAVLAGSSLAASVILWTRRRLGVMDRIHYSLTAAALAVMSLLMQAYGIMGPHLG